MISSRTIANLKIVPLSFSLKQYGSKLQQIRHSGDGLKWCYRERPVPPAWSKNGAIMAASLMYWWVYWNLYHSWSDIIGLYHGKFLPDPRSWTDQELGLRQDSL